MFEKLRGFKVAMVAAVLISQAAGGGSIQATVYDDAVRFTVQNEKVAVMRAEVFNLSGKRLFDSGPVMAIAVSSQRSAIRL